MGGWRSTSARRPICNLLCFPLFCLPTFSVQLGLLILYLIIGNTVDFIPLWILAAKPHKFSRFDKKNQSIFVGNGLDFFLQRVVLLCCRKIYLSRSGLCCMYHNISESECQPPLLAQKLSDKGRNGRERPWRKYKIANELLAAAYESINENKAERLKSCGKVLAFEVDNQTGQKVLVGAESCRVRLCPLCAWRRSLKNFWNTISIVKWLKSNENRQDVGKFSYIFITLTIKNCRGADLSGTIDDLFSGVKRLYERKEIRKAWLGMVRNLEVTHNVNPDSKDYDTFHPHFHMIVAVRPSYFKSRDYISQKRLQSLWRECLRVDYDPVVDIRRVKSKASPEGEDASGCEAAKAVAECSKYAAKSTDYIIPDDWDLTVETVRILDAALDRRRLINYSGIFREVKQKLKLEDCEDGNLVKVGDDNVSIGNDTHREYYWWYSGYRQYYRIEK